jgi:hypothetical protein
MSDVERAKALVQAAGLSGVSVGEAPETVTVSRAELEALRAAQPAPAETPGQEYVRQQQEAGVPQLPDGILSAEQTETEMNRIEAMPVSQGKKSEEYDRLGLTESWEFHKRAGS